MVRSSMLLALVVVLLQAWASSPASASRGATDEERSAVALVARQDPACVTVRISDVDETWALLYAAADPPPTCDGANGAVALHRTATGWKVRLEDAGFPFVCPLSRVPTPIARDFGLCRPPSVRVYVGRFGKLVYKPHRLQQGAHGFFDRLSWRHWGRARTSARGVVDYADRYDRFVLPVHITLSRVRTCGFQRVYTRISIRFVRSSDRARAPGIPGTYTVPVCPS